MNENKYQTAEEKGRKLTYQILSSKIGLVELDINSRADFSGSTITHGDFCLETKYRNVSSTDYDSDFLEVNKLEGLQALADGKMNMIYISIFNDAKARLYNLNNIALTDLKFDLILADKSTTEPELGKEYKMVILLPNAKAKTLKYKQ